TVPSDDVQRIGIVEGTRRTGTGCASGARPAPVRSPAVVADQFDDAQPTRSGVPPQRMRGLRVGPACDTHQMLVLWLLLPLDRAGLHAEGERRQGLVGQAVALQVVVGRAGLGDLAASLDGWPSPCVQYVLDASDVRQGRRLLATGVREREAADPG